MSHTVVLVHIVSEVNVGAVEAYCDGVHVVNGRQMASDVAVLAVDRNCVALHVETERHNALEVLVGGAEMYWRVELHGVTAAH